jgi:serine/threonine protein kinase
MLLKMFFILFIYIYIYVCIKDIWKLLSELLLALATLKGFDIVHRDIKGENIFIKDKHVKLGYIICIVYNFTNFNIYRRFWISS